MGAMGSIESCFSREEKLDQSVFGDLVLSPADQEKLRRFDAKLKETANTMKGLEQENKTLLSIVSKLERENAALKGDSAGAATEKACPGEGHESCKVATN
mmetsp:Transcript_119428/g.338664  ORF Transcript_119428/g.338664 Transcript_119428/m.338664 type:complete len:100 (-) Transcript_119428:138-437(-)|eukprot:CAMPEP_0179280748 /NCGR_PEP_ID=MMETSP0797-20121207/36788_1 /TAXON_ID=47934 /ORGANISM="Dinophysis acuminata, Strain DAEP01" /LENGTH=99 /DNA_ID=CAMNT_0020989415 /DNA_START=48 /DNA_END=347 /DNA_ORIENTATION=+